MIIPKNPGCYIFRDKAGDIIYVGKAKNLQKRVSSYRSPHDPKTSQLISKTASTDFIITDSEVEALILENNLIKKHSPKYNVVLKDSKRYAYINMTIEDFPRLLIARNPKEKGRLFGPFVSADIRDHVLTTLRKAFQVRTCKRMPKRACLRHHLRLCSAPCVGGIPKDIYNERMAKAEMVLTGKTSELIKQMRSEMEGASGQMKFESAIELRDQISALEWLKERQNMERNKSHDEDILGFIVRNESVYALVFNVSRGILDNKQEFEFPLVQGYLDSFIAQYYSENPVPKEIILPQGIDAATKVFLEKRRKGKLIITIPLKGEKHALLKLVEKNIEATFFGQEEGLLDLKSKLNLEGIPEIIECFDVSHLSGTNSVASMVFFRDGRPDKSEYRRFRLRTYDGIDDYRGVKEVVRRRYMRQIKEGKQLPGLIIIDGGKGQLSASLEELNSLELRIPAIAIAKKEEDVFVPGMARPLKFDKKSPAMRLIMGIRDEAHRFAIKYNRLLRSKGALK
jgi:excinuclease ABC subunit C